MSAQRDKRTAIWALAKQNEVLRVTEPTGSIVCSMPGSRLWVTSAEGRVSLHMVEEVMRVFDEKCRGQGKFRVLHDWSQVESYEMSARARFTEWSVRRKGDLASIHLLVHDRMVAMAVSTAGLLLSLSGVRLTAMSSASEFDAEVGRLLG